MGLSIVTEDNILSTHYKSNAVSSYIAIGIACSLLILWLIYQMDVFFIFLFAGAYIILTEHDIYCIINKNTDEVVHHNGGSMRSSYGEEKFQCTILEIRTIETKKYTKKYLDVFQVRLITNRDRRLNISLANLSYSDCHSIANSIHRFLDSRTLLVAAD